VPDEEVLPFDRTEIEMGSMDLSVMVALRKKNQTKQAASGIRGARKQIEASESDMAQLQNHGNGDSGTCATETAKFMDEQVGEKELTIRQKLIQDFQRALDDGIVREKALSTGLNRKHRWTISNTESGNAYNAAVVAVQSVTQVCLLCIAGSSVRILIMNSLPGKADF